MTHEEHCVMAALIQRRFQTPDAARAAWTRMLQNDGWDDDPSSRAMWNEMVQYGESILRSWGWKR